MENRRYLLKAPNHLLHLNALTEVFSGAQLIFTHRRLTEAIPSFFSLTAAFREQYGGAADHNWKRRLVFDSVNATQIAACDGSETFFFSL